MLRRIGQALEDRNGREFLRRLAEVGEAHHEGQGIILE
jgi:hypothetical protein